MDNKEQRGEPKDGANLEKLSLNPQANLPSKAENLPKHHMQIP